MYEIDENLRKKVKKLFPDNEGITYNQKLGMRLKRIFASDNATNKKIMYSYIYKKYMVDSINDINVVKSMFSDFLSGKRTLPDYLAINICKDEKIKVDIGYILGYDSFLCDSYEEYKEYMKLDNETIRKYIRVIEPSGITIIGSIKNNENIYTLRYNHERKVLSFNDMEIFYNEILDVIKDKYMNLESEE